MSDRVASALVVSSFDALFTVLDAVRAGHEFGVQAVVSLGDPASPVPDVTGWAVRHGFVTHHVVLPCRDISMDGDEWVVRFGGDRSELFQPAQLEPLVALGRSLAAQRRTGSPISPMVLHCAAGISRSTAAAAVVAAAAGLGPVEAVAAAQQAQRRSFAFRPVEPFSPNQRILRLASLQLFGDLSLLDAALDTRRTI